MRFCKRVNVGIEWSKYILRNRISLPYDLKKRRIIFIKWYLERHANRPFHVVFSELAHEVLYIEETTLENIIFSEKQET